MRAEDGRIINFAATYCFSVRASFKIREAQNVLQHKLNRPFELINKLHGFPTDVIGQARIDYTLDAASLNTT